MIENINKAFVEVILSGKILIMEFMILAGKIKTTFLQNSPIQPTHIVENNLNKAKKKMKNSSFQEAGDENRTRDNSLEGCSFTTKLHPQ